MDDCTALSYAEVPCEWVSGLLARLQALKVPVLGGCLNRGGRAWFLLPSPGEAGRLLGLLYTRGGPALQNRVLEAVRTSRAPALAVRGWALEEKPGQRGTPWVGLYVPQEDLQALYQAVGQGNAAAA